MNKSGFFPLEQPSFCGHPEHEPPTHLYIPQGQGYRHVCPFCGKEQVLIQTKITYGSTC